MRFIHEGSAVVRVPRAELFKLFQDHPPLYTDPYTDPYLTLYSLEVTIGACAGSYLSMEFFNPSYLLFLLGEPVPIRIRTRIRTRSLRLELF